MDMAFLSRLLALSVLATLTSICRAIAFSSTGSTVELNGIPYYVPPNSVAKLQIDQNLSNAASLNAGLLPLTVVKTNGTTYQNNDLQRTVESYLASDDVFQTGFLTGKQSL